MLDNLFYRSLPITFGEGIIHFLSGSRGFGLFKDDLKRDWDVCIDVRSFQAAEWEIANYNSYKPPTKSGYNDGVHYYITTKDLVKTFTINLIPLHPFEYRIWQQATAIMQGLVNDGNRLEDRQTRLATFEGLRAIIRNTAPAEWHNWEDSEA